MLCDFGHSASSESESESGDDSCSEKEEDKELEDILNPDKQSFEVEGRLHFLLRLHKTTHNRGYRHDGAYEALQQEGIHWIGQDQV